MATHDDSSQLPPRKKQKTSLSQSQPAAFTFPSTSTSTSTAQQTDNLKSAAKMDHMPTQMAVAMNGFQPEREIKVGITHFVNHENPGFSGTLKQRYVTDNSLHLVFFQLGLHWYLHAVCA
jgi:tRNA pseudouridine13 synthase